MQHYLPYLSWIDHQRNQMKDLVIKWANINSHSHNPTGLQEQLKALKSSFKALGGKMEEVPLPAQVSIDEQGNKVSHPMGKALKITKRPEAPIKLFFAGHMDTVYPKNSSFQKAVEQDLRIVGPGVCDMKGGLVVLLTALQALEKSPYAPKIGWEIVINPDEEIGSPGSHELFENAARRHHLGFIFEPAHSDGSVVTSRAGSMKLIVVVRGKAAHAGRDFAKGRSALFAIAPLIVDLEKLNTLKPGHDDHGEDFADHVIVNVGELRSGAGFNVVPDLAVLRINVRAAKHELLEETKKKIQELVTEHGTRDGIWMELHEDRTTPPKQFDQGTNKLFDWLQNCAEDLQTTIKGKPSRGACDGNLLSHLGLAVIDTLGAVGGNIHTHSEFVLIDSLPARAKLTALLLMRLGEGVYSLEDSQSVISL